MKRALLVHGFNVRDKGAGTVGRLRPVLERMGYSAQRFPYGWTHLPGVLLWNDNAASLLASWIVENCVDLVVGHSNGCALIHQATHLIDEQTVITPKVRAIYIAPALYRDAPKAQCVTRCKVLASTKDWACRSAWLMRPLGWGPMGACGPTAPGYDTELRTDMRHSEWFSDDALKRVTEPEIEKELRCSA